MSALPIRELAVLSGDGQTGVRAAVSRSHPTSELLPARGGRNSEKQIHRDQRPLALGPLNRSLLLEINRAAFAVWNGATSPARVDASMAKDSRSSAGPLARADTIGIDVCLRALESAYRITGAPYYRPCPLLANMVAVDLLGRTSGAGFYDYSI